MLGAFLLWHEGVQSVLRKTRRNNKQVEKDASDCKKTLSVSKYSTLKVTLENSFGEIQVKAYQVQIFCHNNTLFLWDNYYLLKKKKKKLDTVH